MKKSKTLKKDIWIDNMEYALLALPAVVLVFIFCYLPMYGVIIAFKNFNPNLGIWGSEWVGLSNFKFFFTSQDALRVTRNTILYNGGFIIIDLIMAVILALMFFNLRRRALIKTYNTIVLIPKFMSMVLVAYIVYALLNPVSGVVNRMLELLGIQGVDWYSVPSAWPWVLTIVHIWLTVGMNSILYYSALMGIDTALFEVATIDGASKLQMITKICIPHLYSIMCITSILAVGGIFGGDFGLFYQVPRNIGSLYPTTDIIPTYVFRGLQDGNMSISAAIGFFQSLVGMILVIITNLIVKRISPENSLF